MPLWQVVADVVGAALLLVLLFGLGIVLRRRWVSRSGGTFELSFRQAPAGQPVTHRPFEQNGWPGAAGGVSTTQASASARGWTLGIGRYSGDVLECFRIFSLSPRPRRRLERCGLTYLGQRVP